MSQTATPATPTLPARDPRGHKGTFGTVCVIAGDARDATMLGAGPLAATAALRAGAGLARLLMPRPLLLPALTIVPSATGRALPVDAANRLLHPAAAALAAEAVHTSDAVVIGPGLGPGHEVDVLLTAVLSAAREPLPANHRPPGVVLDADALNALARRPALAAAPLPALIITPHPGEFARLAAALGLDPDAITPGRRDSAARALAQFLGAVVILKGADTVVADPHAAWRSGITDAALATGGTGDVLAGLIGGLIAQFGTANLPALARAAVTAHARAAAAWRARHHASCGLLAMELCQGLPAALESLRPAAP